MKPVPPELTAKIADLLDRSDHNGTVRPRTEDNGQNTPQPQGEQAS